MKSPPCPNCQEAMSSVERGLGGVWSCIYCEGTWLARDQAEAFPEHFKSPSPGTVVVSAGLVCPDCRSASFETRAAGDRAIHCCMTCSSVFLEKGVLAALLPEAFSANGEAPVAEVLAGILGSALSFDSLPLTLALALQAMNRENSAS